MSSEYLSNVEQTDTEEQSGHPLCQPDTLQQMPPRASEGLASGTFTGLAPVYIVKNVILKQVVLPRPNQPPSASSLPLPPPSRQETPLLPQLLMLLVG